MSAATTGADVVARTLQSLGVDAIFGIVGIPVVEIAEEAISRGIRFIGFRNEQAASYAASAYGYLTGRPGVCLVVGGPGVLHAIAGVGNASANTFPLLLLAGSAESHLVGKGAFQELDAVALLTPHSKLAVRASTARAIPQALGSAFRAAWAGRPGAAFVDFPADVIQDPVEEGEKIEEERGQEMVGKRANALPPLLPSRPGMDPAKVKLVADALRGAKAPLVVIGKGAAYARAEGVIRELIDKTGMPFLPTPMGKGVVPDSNPLNMAAARSTALRHADVVLLLGARLNWILHFGAAPKWNSAVRFIQVDIAAEELGRNGAQPELGIVGDVGVVVAQLIRALDSWRWRQSDALLSSSSSSSSLSDEYATLLAQAKSKNEAAAASRARVDTVPLTYARAFAVMRDTLERLAPASEGGVVYVSEGANTMDISRSVFAVEQPRLRLDAGTYATMGVGLGYAIAAHAAYNSGSGLGADDDRSGSSEAGDDGGNSDSGPHLGTQRQSRRKKIVAIEGDSAFGFSAMEVETMARYGMDVLIFVLNNGGIYHGDARSADDWRRLQQTTRAEYYPHQPQPQHQEHELSSPSIRQSHQSQPHSQPRNDDTDAARVADHRLVTADSNAAAQTPGTSIPGKGGRSGGGGDRGLRSTSLGWEVRYELLAEACGGRGFLVRTAAELERATAEGFHSAGAPVIVNVIIEAGESQKLVSHLPSLR